MKQFVVTCCFRSPTINRFRLPTMSNVYHVLVVLFSVTDNVECLPRARRAVFGHRQLAAFGYQECQIFTIETIFGQSNFLSRVVLCFAL